jgi:hypothetical protein
MLLNNSLSYCLLAHISARYTARLCGLAYIGIVLPIAGQLHRA